MIGEPFVYRAAIERVVRADWIDVRVDLGFRVSEELSVFLVGVSVPPDGVLAAKAKGFVERWAAERLDPTSKWPVLVRTIEAGPRSGWSAEVWAVGAEVTLNSGLLDLGLVEPARDGWV